jgi:hypothetical protein
MQQFTKAGRITRDRHALRVEIDGWRLGELVIAAADVPKMLNGHAVDVQFVQERPGREVFIGYAGSARISRSGKAINVRIESRMMTAPLKAVQKVITGQQLAARLSAPAPIIDADEEQRRPIDEGLIRSFA